MIERIRSHLSMPAYAGADHPPHAQQQGDEQDF